MIILFIREENSNYINLGKHLVKFINHLFQNIRQHLLELVQVMLTDVT